MIYSKLGIDFCKSLLKAHIGTGCDYLSKVGTKLSAMRANPELTLANFGDSSILNEQQTQIAEQYLVNVVSSNTGNSKTFDELRVKSWKNNNSVFTLPPTSYSIRMGHIPRWWYLYKVCSNLPTSTFDHLEATDYGWDNVDGDLFANKYLNIVPDELVITCSCRTGCTGNRCSCKKNGSKCTDYCKCSNNCKNKRV